MNHSTKENLGREIPPKTEGGLDFQIQSELIRRVKESGGKPDEWVRKYAKIFREIITETPSLFESYQKDKEGTLDSVERSLEESLEESKKNTGG